MNNIDSQGNAMNYRAEVSYADKGKFEQTNVTFEDYAQACRYSEELAERSARISDYRVVAVEAPASHMYVGEKLKVMAVQL